MNTNTNPIAGETRLPINNQRLTRAVTAYLELNLTNASTFAIDGFLSVWDLNIPGFDGMRADELVLKARKEASERVKNNNQPHAVTEQPRPILCFAAVYKGKHTRLRTYTEKEARKQAWIQLGGITEFYQTFPADVDYSAYPEIQALKVAALGGAKCQN